MSKILGVILCGGESRRMGQDKGLMPIGDTIRAKFMSGKLAFNKIPVVFSINKKQFDNYSIYIQARDLIVDDDNLPGPVRGLLSVHKKFPAKDILLLACDMPELDTGTIKNLLDIYYQFNHHEFYVYQDEEYAQPFCGIYTAGGIEKLQARVLYKSLTNISMQYVLNNGDTKRLAIVNRKAFENLNDR